MTSFPVAAHGSPTLAEPGPARRLGRLRALRGRLAAVLAPIRTAGWVALVLGGLALVAGWRFGWVEAWALAISLGALLLIAVVLVLGRTAYRVDLDLAERRVVVGGRAAGRLRLSNTSRRALLPSRVQLPVGAGMTTFRVPRLARDAEHEEVFTIPATRRGVFTVGPVSAVRGDPLGLLTRVARWDQRIDLFVHPRTVALEGASAGFLRDIEGQATQDLSSSDVSFHALREYAAGDDRRAIHWRTTARVGRLMVRQFEETRRSHLAVVLSTSDTDFADDEEFELGVSVAASLGMQAVREEKPLTVLAGSGALRTGTPGTMLDDLAGVERATGRDEITGMAQAAAVAVPGASSAVLLVGSGATPAQLRSAATRLPLGVHVVAVRCVPGEQLSRRAIGGLPVLTVGDLSELPKGMRAVSR